MKSKFKINWENNNPILSKQLRFWGTIIILFSFIIQNLYFNKWDKELKNLEQSQRDYTDLTKSSLEYQSLFLNLPNDTSSINQLLKISFIKQAASKYRLGKMISYNVDHLKNEKDAENYVNITNELLSEIKNVTDMPTLYEFVYKTNKLLPDNLEEYYTSFLERSKKRSYSNYLFVILQIVVSIILALGIMYQK